MSMQKTDKNGIFATSVFFPSKSLNPKISLKFPPTSRQSIHDPTTSCDSWSSQQLSLLWNRQVVTLLGAPNLPTSGAQQGWLHSCSYSFQKFAKLMNLLFEKDQKSQRGQMIQCWPFFVSNTPFLFGDPSLCVRWTLVSKWLASQKSASWSVSSQFFWHRHQQYSWDSNHRVEAYFRQLYIGLSSWYVQRWNPQTGLRNSFCKHFAGSASLLQCNLDMQTYQNIFSNGIPPAVPGSSSLLSLNSQHIQMTTLFSAVWSNASAFQNAHALSALAQFSQASADFCCFKSNLGTFSPSTLLPLSKGGHPVSGNHHTASNIASIGDSHISQPI